MKSRKTGVRRPKFFTSDSGLRTSGFPLPKNLTCSFPQKQTLHRGQKGRRGVIINPLPGGICKRVSLRHHISVWIWNRVIFLYYISPLLRNSVSLLYYMGGVSQSKVSLHCSISGVTRNRVRLLCTISTLPPHATSLLYYKWRELRYPGLYFCQKVSFQWGSVHFYGKIIWLTTTLEPRLPGPDNVSGQEARYPNTNNSGAGCYQPCKFFIFNTYGKIGGVLSIRIVEITILSVDISCIFHFS
jgi:hypothetical protein